MRPVQPPAFSNNQLEGHSAERMPQPYGRATPTQRSGWSGSVRIQNPDYDPDHSQELMVSMYRRISSQKIPSKSRNLQVLQILVQDKITRQNSPLSTAGRERCISAYVKPTQFQCVSWPIPNTMLIARWPSSRWLRRCHGYARRWRERLLTGRRLRRACRWCD